MAALMAEEWTALTRAEDTVMRKAGLMAAATTQEASAAAVVMEEVRAAVRAGSPRK